MADLLHPIEYAYLRAIMNGVDFSQFHDENCDMRFEAITGSTYFDRVLKVEFYSGTRDDIRTDGTTGLNGGGEIEFELLDDYTVCNVTEFTVSGDRELSFCFIHASGLPICYASVKRPKMLVFGNYIVQRGDIIFHLNGNLSPEFSRDFLQQVFIQEEIEHDWGTCKLALFEGDPSTGYINIVAESTLPTFEYRPSGFSNTSLKIITLSTPTARTATHAGLYAYDNISHMWYWLIVGALSRPVLMAGGATSLRFEPGDLALQSI